MFLHIPKQEEFQTGFQNFRENEPRDAMYKVATFLVSHYWGQFAQMSDSLGVLLLTWNQACYRYGSFSFDELETCLRENWASIKAFRARDIFSLAESDSDGIATLFDRFLAGLQIAGGNARGRRSPVAVAKALHLLAPEFFPLWDDKIARAYRCHYSREPAEKYFLFSHKTKTIAQIIRGYHGLPQDVTLWKLIDEYNFAKYTRKWI
jgi:hypothetical protein